ncbi:MAG: hypothetical protein ACREMA_07735 [Longimicrobiales bacterium]
MFSHGVYRRSFGALAAAADSLLQTVQSTVDASAAAVAARLGMEDASTRAQSARTQAVAAALAADVSKVLAEAAAAGIIAQRDIALFAASSAQAAKSQVATALAALLAAKPSFSAHKNGSSQINIADDTMTQVTFGTEVHDEGGHFASNVWTPPAGLVTIAAGVLLTGDVDADARARIAITKNGATTVHKEVRGTTADASGQCGLGISILDRANGTDAYGVAVQVPLAAGTATADGAASASWFMGAWLGV